MQQPTISVIMATYNEPLDYLKLAIESILNQSFEDFEFIIILDNPDNQEIENFIKQYQQKDNRIVFLKNKKNLWLAASLNRWIEIAKWKYIARMDADDISEKNRFEEQIKYFQKNNVDILFTWTNLIDENWKKVWEFKTNWKEVENFEKYIFVKPLWTHPTLMIKSEILKKFKYDEKNSGAEDLELWLNCIENWYKFWVVEKILFNYREPNIDNWSRRISRLKHYSFYTFRVLWKHKKYFYKRKDFWFKFFYSFFAWCSLKFLPKRFNIFLFKMLDKRRKNK